MRPVYITNIGVEARAARVNYRQQNFKIGFGVVVNDPGVDTYTVQHTFDDPANFSGHNDWVANANWFDNADTNLVNATTNRDGNYAFPIQGIRLNSTVNSLTQMTILQA